MKHLKDIIILQEGLKLGSSKINTYSEYPKDKEELSNIIEERLEKDPNADLNDIDVSAIKDMKSLFAGLDPHNIKIDEWDVSHVNDFSLMFYNCENLECDVSKWNVSSGRIFSHMFDGCENFDCNLNKWNVNENARIFEMFAYTLIENHPPKWFEEMR